LRLACSETTFVAVRSEAGRVVEGRVAVANALPAGWAEDFLGGTVFPCAGPADLGLDNENPEDDLAADELADLDDEDLFIDEDGSDAGQSTLASSWAGLVESKPIGGPDADRLQVVFVGSPAFERDEALLFDSARNRGGLPEGATLARLVVRFPEGSPDPSGLYPGPELRVFVDDPTTPRARVRLAELVRGRAGGPAGSGGRRTGGRTAARSAPEVPRTPGERRPDKKPAPGELPGRLGFSQPAIGLYWCNRGCNQ
jgi:hypothetical protein